MLIAELSIVLLTSDKLKPNSLPDCWVL